MEQQHAAIRFFLTFFIFAGTIHSTTACGQVLNVSNKIIGGTIVSRGEIPWQVALMREYITGESILYCGGTILTEDSILTAASCLINALPTDFAVVVGEHNLNANDQTEQKIAIDRFIIHENFHSFVVYINDIAILKLNRSIEFNDYVQPVCLPTPDQECVGDVKLTGWGKTQSEGHQGIISEYLREVTAPVITDQACLDVYGEGKVSEKNICTAAPEGGKDACEGDSGGPVTQGNLLCGIMSWSQGCALPGKPGVNTEVLHFMDWINANMDT